MATAVALVQAYLHVNGYFTVTEYPVLEAYRRDETRAVTDLDVLTFRFAHPAHDIKQGRGRRSLGGQALIPDPVLGCSADQPDMIVGEVKEGAARFGCCPPSHVGPLTQQLLSQGRAVTPAGHAVRMVAFSDGAGAASPHAWTCVPMRHVVEFLQSYLRQHWGVLRGVQIREPALGVLALMEKWHVDAPGSPGPVTQHRKRERVRGRASRGEDAHPRGTV